MAVLPRATDDLNGLIAGIRRGHAAAATAFYVQYRGLVERTLVGILGFDTELPDTVQQTFVRAFRATRSLRDPQALPSWLVRITECTAIDLIRGRARRRWLEFLADPQQAANDLVSGSSDFEGRQALEAARAILARLPAKERIVFMLRRLDDMKLKDVALACNCSLATAKRRLARAQKQFLAQARKEQALAGWPPEASPRASWPRSNK